MHIQPVQYAESLEALSLEKPGDEKSVVQHFLQLLRKRHQSHMAREVLRALIVRADDQNKTIQLTVETAHPASKKTKQAIETLLKKHFPKKTLRMTYNENQELIGGFRAYSREVLIDRSIRNELRALEQHLNQV